MTPLLAQLKTQTADCHAELEKVMDVFQRVQTREAYGDLLARFFTLYEPLEDRLGAAADWSARGWDFEARRRTSLLRDDLLALGVSVQEIASWARCKELPTVEGIAGAVGGLYVLEGSTLGGQFISKHFQEKLGVTAEIGGKFFYGAGPATMPQWRAFGQWVETQAASAGTAWEAPAVSAARQTFTTFAHWMAP